MDSGKALGGRFPNEWEEGSPAHYPSWDVHPSNHRFGELTIAYPRMGGWGVGGEEGRPLQERCYPERFWPPCSGPAFEGIPNTWPSEVLGLLFVLGSGD